jgi:hypothetical protein
MNRYRWSVTLLTIPDRAEYLRRFLISLNNTVLPGNLEVVVIYNARARDSQADIEQAIQGYAPRLKVAVYFNSQDQSIAGGRNFQLNLCKGDLICFVDDDVTLHGPVFPTLEQALRDQSVGLVGLRSFVNGTEDQFKPRHDTPHVDRGAFRFMPVQGLLCAGYRELFNDVGGFNPRRRFWGEWTELNLRMWRMGYPTGYAMTGGFLRHWLEAPSSPTRNLAGREANVLWGLICTAIEYDAVDANEATEAFWRLVEDRYLSYSFGDALTPRTLLRTTLELMPMLSAEWSAIARHKEAVARHPFPFKPFQALSDKEVDAVLEVASRQMQPYRAPIFSTGPATTWIRRLFRLWRTEPRPRRSPVAAQAAQSGDEPFRN